MRRAKITASEALAIAKEAYKRSCPAVVLERIRKTAETGRFHYDTECMSESEANALWDTLKRKGFQVRGRINRDYSYLSIYWGEGEGWA